MKAGRTHTAIQAGGNVGIFPAIFGLYFQTVITFEPCPQNWECLLHNLKSAQNVKASNAGLCAQDGWARLRHDVQNSGASSVVKPNPMVQAPMAGARVDMTFIDKMGLLACDLLQLDIEGLELEALKGAMDTIYKHKPIIVLEFNACMERYGVLPADIHGFLADFGYTEDTIHRRHRDHVFTFKGGV